MCNNINLKKIPQDKSNNFILEAKKHFYSVLGEEPRVILCEGKKNIINSDSQLWADIIVKASIDKSVNLEKLQKLKILLKSSIGKMLSNTAYNSVCNEIIVKVKFDSSYNPEICSDNNTANVENNAKSDQQEELDFVKKAEQYNAQDPIWTFDNLIIPQEVLENLETALAIIEFEPKVFDQWGLRTYEPYARSALNFYGPPGTGKTMAAHAIANKLNKKILVASYAQIESKYHGEGPKNVEAIFLAAQRDDAVLFIDEADWLLSKRLLNVSQGSEQAINSMRSQLLICLEKFKGIIIFATNLVKNYDYAFETRVKNINFTLPDFDCRKKIWKVHLIPTIPQNLDIDIDYLSEKYNDFCGRDIKNAVVDACITVAMKKRELVSQDDLIKSCEKIIGARKTLHAAKDDTVKVSNYEISEKDEEKIRNQIINEIKVQKNS